MKSAVPAAAVAMWSRIIVRERRNSMGKRRWVGVVRMLKYCWMEKRIRMAKQATNVPMVRPSFQAQADPPNVRAMTKEV